MQQGSSTLRKFREVVLHSGSMPLPGFRLRSLRGQGSYGQVWSADGPDGKRYALKFIPNRHSRVVVQELRNLQTMQTLDHVNLLKFDRIWCHSGFVIVSMELADGSLLDLFNFYQQELGRPMEPRHCCQLLLQAAHALDYLHSARVNKFLRGFQHCDIKPSNLLIFGDTVKVADYGLATRMNMNLTTLSLGGTMDYCAPEAFQGRVSTQTDQFSLAVTYCHLRGGKLPFQPNPDNVHSLQYWLSPNLSSIPYEEQNIVARALHPQPEKRWTSCGEFMANLTQLVDALEP